MTAREAIYVVYRGDEVLAVGTKEECAYRLGIKESFVEWMATPTAHRKEASGRGRMVAERVTV